MLRRTCIRILCSAITRTLQTRVADHAARSSYTRIMQPGAPTQGSCSQELLHKDHAVRGSCTRIMPPGAPAQGSCSQEFLHKDHAARSSYTRIMPPGAPAEGSCSQELLHKDHAARSSCTKFLVCGSPHTIRQRVMSCHVLLYDDLKIIRSDNIFIFYGVLLFILHDPCKINFIFS